MKKPVVIIFASALFILFAVAGTCVNGSLATDLNLPNEQPEIITPIPTAASLITEETIPADLTISESYDGSSSLSSTYIPETSESNSLLVESEYKDILDVVLRYVALVNAGSESNSEMLLDDVTLSTEIKSILSETGVLVIQSIYYGSKGIRWVTSADHFTNEEYAIHILMNGRDLNVPLKTGIAIRLDDDETSLGKILVIRLSVGEADFLNKYNFTDDEERDVKQITDEIRLECAKLNDKHLAKGGRRILVIDDNNFMLLDAGKMLRDDGATIGRITHGNCLFFRKEQNEYKLKAAIRF